jgi:pyruvate-formate lyase
MVLHRGRTAFFGTQDGPDTGDPRAFATFDDFLGAYYVQLQLNVFEGALEPATPDGREAGAALSNSMSPSNGAEKKGPTAVFNSLAKIDQRKIGFGNSVNMKLPVGALESPKGIASVARLVQVYFGKGGFHVQFNVVDPETLRRAQRCPDAYGDLIVRVSGYSAYFTPLGRQIQDDIIARTELSPCAP